jgi:hypothetical protein
MNPKIHWSQGVGVIIEIQKRRKGLSIYLPFIPVYFRRIVWTQTGKSQQMRSIAPNLNTLPAH